MGHNALASGFQGQRQWTDHFPNGDFMEAILNSSFDWNGIREPFVVATENDSLNGATMLFGHLLTNTAQIFADVRTYWSPAAVKRVTGYTLEGRAASGMIHLINSGAATLDATGQQIVRRRAGDEALVGDHAGRSRPVPGRHPLVSRPTPATSAAAAVRPCFLTRGGMPVTMARLNLVKGLGPVLQIAEGYTVDLPAEVHAGAERAHRPHLADPLVRAAH